MAKGKCSSTNQKKKYAAHPPIELANKKRNVEKHRKIASVTKEMRVPRGTARALRRS